MKNIFKTKFVNAAAVAASFTTLLDQSLDTTKILGFQVNWTNGDGVGSLQLQSSIDGVNWRNLGSAVSVTGSSGTDLSVSSADATFQWVQAVYTRVSGTLTTFEVYAYGKG